METFKSFLIIAIMIWIVYGIFGGFRMNEQIKTCSNCYFCEGQKCFVKNTKIKAYEENCIYWTEKTGGLE